ncbi:thioredoxin [candidate division WWE3 bacterium RBG_19FT_COMBO_34_6]|uniref:Thioredoxin n=1 Tax=candidate division WWE3 bacterium RBG_19FT_COMBO_34_6 TaxID=1802612 RepID=A0A1F4UM77_UNCKA|nr:MAG: thioredoxin [candidate division WWE3 bacterium RBG_19FT_COMBO_34_6]
MLTLLDFYADWCGPCKLMAPIFDTVKKDYTGKIEFKKIDVEQDSSLAMKYGVMGIPTFILLKDDKELDRKIGAMPKEMLLEWLNHHLK